MPKTSPERIIYCRKWRKLTYDQKSFNKCIREYIEVKYDTIFNEFKQFYRDLEQDNSGSKDITKTKEFKLWKKNTKAQQNGSDNQILQVQHDQSDSDNQILQVQHDQSDSDNQNLQVQHDQSDSNNQILQVQHDQSDSDNQNLQVQHDQSDSDDQSDRGNQNNILNQAMNGPLSPEHMSIDQMDELLQEMISDLQQDDNIRALLNDEVLFPNIQEDEGIDLNITDEIDESELLW